VNERSYNARPLKEKYWNAELFRELGRIFARLHVRAQRYKPSNPRVKRQEWHGYDVVDVSRFAPPEEAFVREGTAKLPERLHRLPRSEADYGVTHTDLHPSQLLLRRRPDQGLRLRNCKCAWFVKDIAVILFYVVRAEAPEHRDDAAAAFLAPLLAGYREIRPREREW
jgi:Ser/Thr protein kinase RdoA (MazF antagonist)